MVVTCPYCVPDTAGQHESDCPKNPLRIETKTMSRGWECPKCGKVNAPWKAECGCHIKPPDSNKQWTEDSQ